MAEKIKVHVTAYQRIEYAQDREITPEQFAKYEAICNRGDRHMERDLNKEFEYLIDTSDICDAEDFEDLEITRVDEKGEAA